MQTEHILQLSNNHTVTFQKQGDQILVRVKAGDQPLANAAGHLEDYERMFDLIIGDVPSKPAGGPTREPKNLGPAPKPGQQSSSKPFTGSPSKSATEASKK